MGKKKIWKAILFWGVPSSSAATLILNYFFPGYAIISKDLFISIILIVSLLIAIFRNRITGFYFKVKTNNFLKKNKRTRIVILLPLSIDKQKDRHFSLEVDNSLRGISKAFKKLRERINSVDIVLRDHENKIETTRKIIDEELAMGCRHFISTMSCVCRELINENSDNHFHKLIKNFNLKPSDAVLLCTVSTTSGFQSEQTNIYRFFIEAETEAQTIVEEVTAWLKNGITINNTLIIKPVIKPDDRKEAVAIYSASESHYYSKQSGDKFVEYLSKNSDIKVNAIEIKNHHNENDIETILKDRKKLINDAEILFIIAYFPLNETIIECLLNEDFIIKKCALITPTVFPRIHLEEQPYSNKKESASNIRTLIMRSDKILWYISRPKKYNDKGKTGTIEKNPVFYGELSDFCMNLSVQILVRILTSPDYETAKFQAYWKDPSIMNEITTKFEFKYSPTVNDPKIQTELIFVPK